MTGGASKPDALLGLVCLPVLGLAVFCFVGMLWIGKVPPTLAGMGVCGLAAGATGLAGALGYPRFRRYAYWAGLLGAAAVAADYAHYYKFMNYSGNYYAWGAFGPYALAQLFIAFRAKEARFRGGVLRRSWWGSSL